MLRKSLKAINEYLPYKIFKITLQVNFIYLYISNRTSNGILPLYRMMIIGIFKEDN